MRWVLMVSGAIALLAIVVVVIGLTRPRSHAARTQARFANSPDVVWEAVSDFGRWAEWNGDVKQVEMLPDAAGHRVMNVVGSWGTARTEVTVWEPPRRMETFMDAGGFRGRWTYDLAPSSDGGTVLTVTEEGEVDNPLFRAMMLLHDNHATMMAYHKALAARLGENVVPSKVEITQVR